ncbi:uncharacterized protein LOC135940942 [Cloeon dipterum]|uniref:uncharacterized protein LOC135940942 n=1 Tax=Cloeon dipterum TaxID=197152 RepID=UPI0032200DE4
MSPTMILSLVASSMLVPWATSQTIPIDAAPTEYPYAVRTSYVNIKGATNVAVGLAVSQRYLLASGFSKNSNNATGVELTDQQGVVHPVFSSTPIGVSPFMFFKSCLIFNGPMFSLKAASFNNLSATINDAEVIYFTKDSTVLKKIPVVIMNQTACETETDETTAREQLCVEPNNTPDVCYNFFNTTLKLDQHPMVGIKGQVHGSRYVLGCQDSSWVNVGKWYRFDAAIKDITDIIPVVDLKD